jgi:hypothetical protein
MAIAENRSCVFGIPAIHGHKKGRLVPPFLQAMPPRRDVASDRWRLQRRRTASVQRWIGM